MSTPENTLTKADRDALSRTVDELKLKVAQITANFEAAEARNAKFEAALKVAGHVNCGPDCSLCAALTVRSVTATKNTRPVEVPCHARDWVFSVSPVDTRWHPSGKGPNGEEVWCDGCCVTNKWLAQMIANNMGASFEAGWKAATQAAQAALQKLPLKAQGWQHDHV